MHFIIFYVASLPLKIIPPLSTDSRMNKVLIFPQPGDLQTNTSTATMEGVHDGLGTSSPHMKHQTIQRILRVDPKVFVEVSLWP